MRALLLLLPLLLAACGEEKDDTQTPEGDTDADTDADADADTDADTDANLHGRIVHNPCSPPSDVAIWSVLSGEVACDPALDTGGFDWKDTEVARPGVSYSSTFEALLPPGEYGVIGYTGDCWGCAAFAITEGAETDVELSMDTTGGDWAPYLYLYPRRPTAVQVKLPDPSRLRLSEPAYPDDGWRVMAHPDGNLMTTEGPRSSLFYELDLDPTAFQYAEGWCTDGEQAQASIEQAMADMGFLPNEIADFGEFWDPVFPAAVNLTVYPQTESLYALPISPPPEHMLRALFVLEPGCRHVAAHALKKAPRKGYHAAEWGVVILHGLDQPPSPVGFDGR